MKFGSRKILVLPLYSLAVAAIVGCGGQALTSSTAASPGPTASPSPTPVSGSSGIPTNATTIPDIQKLGGWQSCTACTGSAFAQFSMTQNVATPSLGGASARFALLPGTRPFGGALWFKFLTIDDGATHFVYDLGFYTDNPSAPQALEFNVSQSTGGKRYNFATQCDFSVHRAWMAWSPAAKGWISTGVPCVAPAPNTWNHLVWEFERDDSGHAMFKAVTLNGNRSEMNISMPAIPDTSNGIDVAVQLDANRTASPYSVWVDKIKLSYW